jgi:hypothetical protein
MKNACTNRAIILSSDSSVWHEFKPALIYTQQIHLQLQTTRLATAHGPPTPVMQKHEHSKR